jgi:hypothetical protein
MRRPVSTAPVAVGGVDDVVAAVASEGVVGESFVGSVVSDIVGSLWAESRPS